MAQYHCHVQTISRTPTPSAPKGRSAVAAAAYRAGAKLEDEHSSRAEAQPIVHDYTRRSGVVHAEIVLPTAAPDWARDREQLWNRAEAADTRKNSTLAREYECSLPHELGDAQRIQLAREITAALVSRYGFAADFAVHAPNPHRGDERNHHVHILTSTRVLTGEGFGPKVRVLDSAKTGSDEIRWARQMVAELCNAALARAGIAASVDHRSLVDQRIAALAAGDDELADELDRPATVHRGPAVSAIVADGRESYVEERIQVEIADELAEIGHRQAVVAEIEAEAHALDARAAELAAEAAAVQAEIDAARRDVAAAQVVPIRPPAPDTDTLLAQIRRMWASLDRADGLHDERRDEWGPLRYMGRNGWRPDAPALRAVLDKYPALRREWAAEIHSRDPDIRAALRERAAERVAARRVAARDYLSPVPAPAPAPAPARPEPERKGGQKPSTPLALVPAPVLPVARLADLDAAISDAEARLAALEERERTRRQAADAYRRAQESLRTAQAGLLARLRAWMGLSAPAPVQDAQGALREAAAAVQRQGLSITFGQVVVVPAADDLAALRGQLVALRDERGGLVVAEAEKRRQEIAAVAEVVALVVRLDAAVPPGDPGRLAWRTLVAVDMHQLIDVRAADPYARLAVVLTQQPQIRQQIVAEIASRLPELEALEAARLVLPPSDDQDGDQDDDDRPTDWPAPGM